MSRSMRRLRAERHPYPRRARCLRGRLVPLILATASALAAGIARADVTFNLQSFDPPVPDSPNGLSEAIR
jgi:hypothetical protein